jgi:hypothetical protein
MTSSSTSSFVRALVILSSCCIPAACSSAATPTAAGGDGGTGTDPGTGPGTGADGGGRTGAEAGAPTGNVPPPNTSTCTPAKVALGPVAKLPSPGGRNLAGLGAGDFNGDRKDDLVFADGPNVYVAFSNGDGTFSAPRAYESPNAGYATAVADFDGDGKLDFVNGGIGSNSPPMALFLNKGDGTFKAPIAFDPTTSQNGQFMQAVAADFNGDGKMDLVVGDNGVAGDHAHLVSNSGGTLVDGVNVKDGSKRFAAGKLDSDDLPDLALLGNGVCISLNKTGSFPTSPICYPFSAAARGFSVATGDLDGDGKVDVIVGGDNNDGGVLNVYRNTGGGVLDTPVKVSAGGTPAITDVLSLDVNNDGHADVIGYTYANDTGGKVLVWLNDGKGNLATTPESHPAGFPNANDPPNFTVGDFKGNGLPGVATVDIQPAGNTIDVLTGTCLP